MKFADVHGLSTVKQKLEESIAKGRLPHAQLILGPEGSGNLALALAITQRIYCQNPSNGDSCGTCSSCVKIEKHTHPDVHFSYPTVGTDAISTKFIEDWRGIVTKHPYFNTIDWVSTIAKDENKSPNITRKESRDILSKLSLKPYEGDAKTLIIWMPEYLDKVGNSLLKLIEEPPQKTYFILVAHNFDALLSTITSRTQLVKIPAYTNEEIIDFLSTKYALDKTKAENIAFLSEGNMNNAINFVESVENNYSEMFRNWMLACFTNNLSEASSLIDGFAKLGRVQLQLFLNNGLKILRECLLYLSIEDYEVKFAGEHKDFIVKFSKTLNAKFIEDSYVAINKVIYHIQRNANAKISLFNLSLTLRHNFIRTR